jgi:hypothetical protein
MKIGFSRDFFEKYSNITFHDTSPTEAALFHADSWTDNVEITVVFAIMQMSLTSTKKLVFCKEIISDVTVACHTKFGEGETWLFVSADP